MDLLTLGINHKTAPVAIREKVAFTPEQIVDALHHVRRHTPLREAALLSTCNRTELYGVVEPDQAATLLAWLADYRGVGVEQLQSCYYVHTNQQMVQHMMRVACGLDSMVLGEPQILGQLKTAYNQSQAAGVLGPSLSRLFRHTFEVAKKVRTDTAIGENPISVAFAAVSLSKHIFTDLSQCHALLLGAGETIELVAKHLLEQGITRLVVANRTRERAQELASRLPITPIALSELPEHLPMADIVITSTASQLPILGKGAVERALKLRKYQPMFMVDLAVPRDIEPEVGDLRDVYLYTVDDLQSVIADNIKSREGAAEEAESLVELGVVTFLQRLRELESVDVLKVYRQTAEKMRDEELQKAQRALDKGENAQEVLVQLARGITNKLIHTPSLKIKEASSRSQKEMLAWIQDLFELNDQNKPEENTTESEQ
jgi:glutamyl-tRNA reductase